MKTTTEHRQEVLAKVLPYLESVRENIRLQENAVEVNAFDSLVGNFIDLIKLAQDTKGNQEFVSFAKIIDDALDKAVFLPIGLRQAKRPEPHKEEERNTPVSEMMRKFEEAAKNGGMIQVDGELPQEIREMLEKEGAKAFEVQVNPITEEVNFKGNLKEVPPQIVLEASKQLVNLGIPEAKVLEAIKRNLGIIGG